ncbi:MAG: hypothetical protein RL721_539 [Candidatus Eisenbacteria bacterium]
MTGVHVGEPLLLHHLERLADRVDEAHGRGVRALARGQVLTRLAQVPVEARQAIALDGLQRPRREAHGGDTRGRHESLLRTRHDHVHAPLVLRQRVHAQTGDGVEHQHAAARARDLRQGARVVQRCGAGLAVGAEHHRDVGVGVESLLDLGDRDRVAPRHVDRGVRHAVRLADAAPALTELTAHDAQRLASRRHEVHHAGLHRARARGREHEHLALGLVDPAQVLAHTLVHRAEHVGAVVRRDARQRAQDAVRDLDRSGREQARAGGGAGRRRSGHGSGLSRFSGRRGRRRGRRRFRVRGWA